MGKFLSIVGAVVVSIVIACVVALISAIPVYFLWNWLMPDLFGLSAITFWQSAGISLLCECLFKSHVNVKKD